MQSGLADHTVWMWSDGKSGGMKADSMDATGEPIVKRQRIAVDGLEDDDDQTGPTPLIVEEPLRGPPPAPVIHAPIDDSQVSWVLGTWLEAWRSC